MLTEKIIVQKICPVRESSHHAGSYLPVTVWIEYGMKDLNFKC